MYYPCRSTPRVITLQPIICVTIVTPLVPAYVYTSVDLRHVVSCDIETFKTFGQNSNFQAPCD